MEKARAHYARAEMLSKEKRKSKALAHMRRAMKYGRVARLGFSRVSFGMQSRVEFARTLMSELLCPVKQSLMRRPAIIDSGITYDYDGIMNWWRNSDDARCPKTRQKVETVVADRSVDAVTKWFVGAYEDESGDEWDEIVDACSEYETERGWPDATNLVPPLHRWNTTDLTEATTLLPLLYGWDTTYLMLEPTTVLSGESAGRTMERARVPSDARSVRNVTILAITRAFVAHYGERNGVGWDEVARACARRSAGKSAESDWSERVMADLERMFDDS
jgi:hypothetical protein